MGIVNTYPRGLLGLLNAKTGGRTPQDVTETVQTVLDIFPFYAAQMRETVSANSLAIAGTGAIFPTTGFAVPNDEIWLVLGYSAAMNGVLAVAEFLGFTLIRRSLNNAGNSADLILTPQLTTGLTTGLLPQASAQSPFLMIPGDQLGASIYHRVATVNTIRFDAEIVAMQI